MPGEPSMPSTRPFGTRSASWAVSTPSPQPRSRMASSPRRSNSLISRPPHSFWCAEARRYLSPSKSNSGIVVHPGCLSKRNRSNVCVTDRQDAGPTTATSCLAPVHRRDAGATPRRSLAKKSLACDAVHERRRRGLPGPQPDTDAPPGSRACRARLSSCTSLRELPEAAASRADCRRCRRPPAGRSGPVRAADFHRRSATSRYSCS